MEPSRPPSIGKRLWRIVQVVFYMLRKGISKQKLAMDLHLLLQRGKLAGKAIGNLMSHHHGHHHGGAAFSCRSVDPDMAFYNPREVEFSCSNTPAFPSLLHVPTKRNKNKHHRKLDAAAVAKAFEIFNSQVADGELAAAAATPSPAMWGFGKSPMVVRQLRITDSPFPVKEDGEVVDGRVDKEAEDFIKRFYEQLRRQQLLPPTPEYGGGRRPRVST